MNDTTQASKSYSAGATEGAPCESLALCVDLDGTLVRTDLLHESLAKLVCQQPGSLVGAAFSLLRGKAAFKDFIAERVQLRTDLLPYREEVVEYVREERERGRRTVLVTASHQQLADQVAEHLGIFHEVYGTSPERNLKGKTKADFLAQQFERFEYIGDSSADAPVWRAAERAGVVSAQPGVVSIARSHDAEARVFDGAFRLKTIPRMLRVHQWVKNLLIFLPPIMAHEFDNAGLFLTSCIAFLLFSLTASSVYMLNDLMDLENDRVHATKRNRPLASGAISPQFAVGCVALLLTLVAILTTLLPIEFGVTLITYFLLTSAYSVYLKRVAILDVVTLASLYTIRIIAGGTATGIVVSEWLLAFSLFMFFSLACVKRFSELLALQERNLTHVQGRGYHAGDIEQIAMFGSISGYLAVLVMALYINSPAVVDLYSSPRALWLLCPTLLYWVTRVWLLARRGEVHEDPIVFALRDRVSYLVLLISAGILLFAI